MTMARIAHLKAAGLERRSSAGDGDPRPIARANDLQTPSSRNLILGEHRPRTQIALIGPIREPARPCPRSGEP